MHYLVRLGWMHYLVCFVLTGMLSVCIAGPVDEHLQQNPLRQFRMGHAKPDLDHAKACQDHTSVMSQMNRLLFLYSTKGCIHFTRASGPR
eukprot:961711-Amphidinium_carterae.3